MHVFVSRCLIGFGKVKTSMESGSELRNVADLAEELLQHSPGVNHTLGLYYRLAFMVRILLFLLFVHSSPLIHRISAAAAPLLA